MTTSTEITDFKDLEWRIVLERSYAAIRAKIILNGVYAYAYLCRDGKVYTKPFDHQQPRSRTGYWGFKENAERFLAQWLERQKAVAIVTCTCNSIDLFNQGCTCGFLQRSTP